jgi:hypothetical protein
MSKVVVSNVDTYIGMSKVVVSNVDTTMCWKDI